MPSLHSEIIRSVQFWASLGGGDRVACVEGGSVLTYGGLWERSGWLAGVLRGLGVGRDVVVVAVVLPRSVDFVVAVVGVLRAGGAFVPVDPEYPGERQGLMVGDSGARVVVCRGDTRVAAVGAAGGCQVVDLDGVDAGPGGGRPGAGGLADDGPAGGEVPGAAAAYVIYTSGSTGRPKGVVVEHRNLNHLHDLLKGYRGLTGDDIVLMFASVSFDASVFEMVMAVANGARLAVVPNIEFRGLEIGQFLADFRVSVATLPPTLLEITRRRPLPDLRLLISAGSELGRGVAERWAGPPWLLVNAYGPTEGTVVATAGVVGGGDGVVPSIGGAVGGVAVYVLDGGGGRVGAGGVGEVFIGGLGVARGYVGDAVLTAARFVPDPFCGVAGARMYRTGDLAVVLADGRLGFRGRVDRQVQVRGFRVEPVEVEAALCEVAGVRQAAVVVVPGAGGGAGVLAGFVVGGAGVSARGVREGLGVRVPGYLVPDVIEVVSHIPVTLSGKRDEGALVAVLEGRRAERASGVAGVRGDEVVAGIIRDAWCEVLGVEQVGDDDDFFALGGDSMRAIRVCHALERRGIDLPLEDVFVNSTPALQVMALRKARSSGHDVEEPR
jgi:amino acid adenylation domain-containing protein